LKRFYAKCLAIYCSAILKKIMSKRCFIISMIHIVSGIFSFVFVLLENNKAMFAKERN